MSPPSGNDAVCRASAARLEEAERQLAESKALLATEIADRTQADAARVRLLRRLVVAQEDERRRIARELHDDLGQRVTALRLTLESVGERAAPPSAIAKALGLLVGIDKGLDFIAWELRPAALDELGLAKVLETYVHEWSLHAGVQATFHSSARPAERLAPEVEVSVYRIAQEALNNVAKHAHARGVNVLLEHRGGTIALIVEDDGVGPRLPGAGETSIGLAGMRERAAAMGGTLELEPTPGGGTTVLAKIPLPAAGDAGAGQETGPFPSTFTAAANLLPYPSGSSDTSGAALTSIRLRLQELQRAVGARDEFIATVAHELRNPIAPLSFQLRLAIEKTEQLAADGAPVPVDWVQTQLRRAEQRLNRLLETLDRLLDLSHLSTGRIELQPEAMNLGSAVREVIGTLAPEFAVARCDLRLSEGGDTAGWWDRLRLEQICRNLLSNAIRFGAGRPIEVSVAADREFARLEVRDHGPGIEPEQQLRIFERVERGDKPSGGFGVGLWVVRNICAAMGGTVSVESRAGEGARFTVMLPRGGAGKPVDVEAE